jgi:bifunctional DNase/RNase
MADTRSGLGSAQAVPGAVAFELELLAADGQEIERILLREAEGIRRLILPIGGLENRFLYFGVGDSHVKWMGPHATMARFIEALGAMLLYVIIDKRAAEGYFTAKAILTQNENIIELPVRPSDGLCLALISGVPYLVAEDLVSKEITDVYSPCIDRE